jgi:hypothetical protein
MGNRLMPEAGLAVRHTVEDEGTTNIYCLKERLFAFRLVESTDDGVSMVASARATEPATSPL